MNRRTINRTMLFTFAVASSIASAQRTATVTWRNPTQLACDATTVPPILRYCVNGLTLTDVTTTPPVVISSAIKPTDTSFGPIALPTGVTPQYTLFYSYFDGKGVAQVETEPSCAPIWSPGPCAMTSSFIVRPPANLTITITQ